MRIKEIYPNIYMVTAINQFYLNHSFQRIQEFYESSSSKFKNKLFKKEVFNKWFTKKYKKDYYNFWEGFNIYRETIDSFNKIYKKEKLDDYEESLFSLLKTIPKKSRYCVIGVLEKDSGTVQHELIHGVFYLNDKYRQEVRDYFCSPFCDKLNGLRKKLSDIGYGEEVMIDELNAYVLVEKEILIIWKLWNKDIEMIQKDLRYLLNKVDPFILKNHYI
jgi:hypothetical protein